MTLQRQIQIKQEAIKNTEVMLLKAKHKLAYLKTLREVKMSELYEALENAEVLDKEPLFIVEYKKGTAEIMLGGDGRSSPSSEFKEGLIATITTNHVYFNEEQVSIIRDFVSKRFPNVIAIKFKEEI